MEHAAFLPLAHRLADAAAAVALRHFRQPVTIDSKADASPVTQADREAEQAMRALIQAELPDHGIIGEEFSSHQPEAEWCWVLDPIDGTRNFIAGIPLFTTLIALCHRNRPVLGIIAQPFTGERWVGVTGQRSYYQRGEGAPSPLTCRTSPPLKQARLATTSPHLFSEAGLPRFERLRAATGQINYGADAYAYALLAQGQLDLVCEEGLKFHDIAALLPVLEGAGATVTDWRGAPIQAPDQAGSSAPDAPMQILAAASPALHAEALALLAA